MVIPFIFVDWLNHNDEHQNISPSPSGQTVTTASTPFPYPIFFFFVPSTSHAMLQSPYFNATKNHSKSYTITWGFIVFFFFEHIPIIMLSFIYITLHSDSDHSSIGFRYFSMKEQWKTRLVLEKKKKRKKVSTTLSLSLT